MLWPQNFKKYNLLCWYEGDFCLGGRGAGCLQMGRVGIRKKKEKSGRRGSVDWTYINFSRRFHRRTLRRWSRRWFWRNNRHVTVQICHFKSVGDSVGNINGGRCTSCLFESIGDPVWKNNPPKPPRQRPTFFLTTKTFPSVIQSVTTDGKFSSVVTDWITDGILSVGNFDLKLPTKIFRR